MTARICKTLALSLISLLSATACAPATEQPEGNWIGVRTAVHYLTDFGSRIEFGSWMISGDLVQEYPPSIGFVSERHFVQSGGDGYYYVQDAVVPGRWLWSYNTGPCAGLSDSEDFQNHQIWDFLCTVQVPTLLATGFLTDGTPVHTGGNDKLYPGFNEVLYPSECRTSADGDTELCYQGDGNLVLYLDGQPVWASNSVGTSPGFAVMQGDGNFVVYNASGTPVWASNTAGFDGASIVVQSYGCAVMFSADGSHIPWFAGTCWE